MSGTVDRCRHRLASRFALVFTLACGGEGSGEPSTLPPTSPPPPPTPAVLAVDLTTPNADDGAVLLTVRGPLVDSVTVAPYAGTVSVGGGGAKVLVYGNVRGGVVARLFVRDAQRTGEYSVSLNEVASRTTFQQRAVSGYGVTLRKE